MQGGKLNTLPKRLHDIVVDQHRTGIPLARMHYAVPHGQNLIHALDYALFLVQKSAYNEANGHLVIGHISLHNNVVLVPTPMFEETSRQPNLLHQAFCQHRLIRHVKDLVLE